jgi:hypothetical protein
MNTVGQDTVGIPFTSEQFFDVFENYNLGLPYAYPVMIVLAILIVVIIILWPRSAFPRTLLILSVMWAWTGVGYHLIYFAEINFAANFFGALFVIQAGLLLWCSVRGPRSEILVKWDLPRIAGSTMIVFALVAYPAIGTALGHHYPRSPTFGLPCPLTIFTFGVLLLLERSLPFYLLIIPVIWAIIGSSATVIFGVWQDISLPVAAAVSVVLTVLRHRKD